MNPSRPGFFLLVVFVTIIINSIKFHGMKLGYLEFVYFLDSAGIINVYLGIYPCLFQTFCISLTILNVSIDDLLKFCRICCDFSFFIPNCMNLTLLFPFFFLLINLAKHLSIIFDFSRTDSSRH